MLRNSWGGEPDVEYEDDDAKQIELIEVEPDEILCAFVVECPPSLQEAAKKHWTEFVAPATAHSMLKFIQNHHGD